MKMKPAAHARSLQTIIVKIVHAVGGQKRRNRTIIQSIINMIAMFCISTKMKTGLHVLETLHEAMLVSMRTEFGIHRG